MTNNSMSTSNGTGFANVSLNVGSGLSQILNAADITPGDSAGYEVCKLIYTNFVKGARLASSPITLAQSQKRAITVRSAPGDEAVNEFIECWNEHQVDEWIHTVMTLSRVYGVATGALQERGKSVSTPLKMDELHKHDVVFKAFDPLNTAGSLTMEQDPNAFNFQKPLDEDLSVSGTKYHNSRIRYITNGPPIYIAWTASAFGYVGRSVYQSIMFEIKAYIATEVMHAQIAAKAAALVYKQKSPGSITNNVMQALGGIRRQNIKDATNGQVLTISVDESIESINMQNLEGPAALARKGIMDDMAAGADMPPQLINDAQLSAIFSEGKEDAKTISKYTDGVRDKMLPLYLFADRIIMRKAWTPEFINSLREKYPDEYKGKTVEAIFYSLMNSFVATWPSLLVEPESEKIKVADTKLKAVIALVQVLAPMIDPENRMELIKWAVDAITEDAKMFSTTIDFDYDVLAEYEPPTEMSVSSGKQGVTEGQVKGGKPATRQDKGSEGKAPPAKGKAAPGKAPPPAAGGKVAPPAEKGVQPVPGKSKIKLATADSIGEDNYARLEALVGSAAIQELNDLLAAKGEKG